MKEGTGEFPGGPTFTFRSLHFVQERSWRCGCGGNFGWLAVVAAVIWSWKLFSCSNGTSAMIQNELDSL